VFESATQIDARGAGDGTKPRSADSGHHKIEPNFRHQAVVLFQYQRSESSPSLPESDKTEPELSRLHPERRLDE
jgi:hypothetical protein